MMTGGIPSSAAVTAANQAGQYYATQLADKLPALTEAASSRSAARQALLLNALEANRVADDSAYQRYLDEVGMDYDRLEMLRALRNDDYVRYRDELAQYHTDRDFGYHQFTDDLQYQNNRENYDTDLALAKEQYADELARADEENLWNAAVYALQYLNDASLLKKLVAKAREV